MKKFSSVILLSLLIVVSCKSNKSNTNNSSSTTGNNPPPPVQNVLGYNLFNKIKGIWNGPVTSTTPLGGYPEWIVDFRPVSENQISSKNELDTLNSINMSFFIALYNNQYKVAFRNGGQFNGLDREAYFLADSVSEQSTKSYYRFSEIVKGKNRAYTEVVFKQDSLIVKVYTNKNNSQTTTSPHMAWMAKLQDTTACMPAVSNFGFPKKTMTKDFSTTFIGVTEAIYYQLGGDPYPESAQPYLGKTTASYSYDAAHVPVAGKKTFLVITTQPLINGTTVDLKHRSRYVILADNDFSYTFNYMHPGAYYLYALYDADGNSVFNAGDWMNNPVTPTTFTLASTGTTTASTQINFTIP
ncbi:MAG TPA: hypothetical protein VK835_00320 [Bacteroidia bacterium]|jgi:hypothetical protein|nr:hypothetical protein [Bacteroidia bacterium]